eukprot:1611257-Prymnesium_polylepis.1
MWAGGGRVGSRPRRPASLLHRRRMRAAAAAARSMGTGAGGSARATAPAPCPRHGASCARGFGTVRR